MRLQVSRGFHTALIQHSMMSPDHPIHLLGRAGKGMASIDKYLLSLLRNGYLIASKTL